MGNGSAKPAPLPKGAPSRLKKFVICKQDAVQIDTTDLGWVPKGPFGDFGPSIGIKPGASPNTATITYGDLELPASIGADGQLVVDASNVPGGGPLNFLQDAINDWVKAFNATMKANEKKLDGFAVKGTKVTLTKTPAAPAPDETEVVVPGGVIVPPPAPDKSEPAEKPAEAEPDKGGCYKALFGLLILVIFIIAVVGVLFLTGNGDDDPVSTDQTEPTNTVVDEPAEEPAQQEQTEPIEPVDEADTADEPVEPSEDPPESPEPEVPVVEIAVDSFPLEPLVGDRAWDVETETSLGDYSFPAPVTVRLFIGHEPVADGYPYLALVTPATEGALEVWLFNDETSEQTGSTTHFPADSEFPTFGAGPGQGSSTACGDGFLVLGTIPETDPRSVGSWGISLYTNLGSADGFPGGATGTGGAFIGDMVSDGLIFAIDPDTGATIRRAPTPEEAGGFDPSTDELEDELGCLNDPDTRDAIDYPGGFFGPPPG